MARGEASLQASGMTTPASGFNSPAQQRLRRQMSAPVNQVTRNRKLHKVDVEMKEEDAESPNGEPPTDNSEFVVHNV